MVVVADKLVVGEVDIPVVAAVDKPAVAGKQEAEQPEEACHCFDNSCPLPVRRIHAAICQAFSGVARRAR